jgi:hypothetical protein
MNYIDQIERMGACLEALDWLRESDHPTPEAAWAACSRADWMLWLLGRGHSIDRQKLVFCTCDIAETALIHIPPDEVRPRTAIETARRWARGEAGKEEVRPTIGAVTIGAARSADAAVDAAVDAAAYAAYAARAARAAAHDAAAWAADAAVHAAAWAAAWTAAWAATTDIVRRYFPNPPELTGASQ